MPTTGKTGITGQQQSCRQTPVLPAGIYRFPGIASELLRQQGKGKRMEEGTTVGKVIGHGIGSNEGTIGRRIAYLGLEKS